MKDSKILLAAMIISSCGCGSESVRAPAVAGGSAPQEPIGVQILRVVPELKSQRFNNLLSFESSNDSVFIATAGKVVQDAAHAHTGVRSLKIEAETAEISVKLSSLLPAGAFPGQWTLAGAYFCSESPGEVIAQCIVGERVVSRNRVAVAGHEWQPVFLDISNVAARADDERVRLKFEFISMAGAWCDDVMLIDNTEVIVAPDPADSRSWAIRRRGWNLIGEVTGWFRFTLVTPQGSPDGWTITEANALRARFSSPGKTREITMYYDGRGYWDGEFRPLGEAKHLSGLAEAHTSPAQIDIPEEFGRLERNSSGDANNDGYNECRGAYQLIANTSRVQLTMIPRTVPVLKPVLEVKGLPQGSVLVTIEGRLVEQMTRLEDGTLLVQIPARIDRPTNIYLRVQ